MRKILLLSLLILSVKTFAQCDSLPMIDSFEINNVKAYFPSHTNLFGSVIGSNGDYKIGAFYKNAPQSTIFASSLWISGFSPTGLKGMFRRFPSYNDKLNQSGPKNNCLSSSSLHCNFWNQIFKADIDSINLFIRSSGAFIPKQILQWPAKGNPYLLSLGIDIQEDVAPFIDIDGNGFYNPNNGDYPAIKGSKMFFSIENNSEYPYNPLSIATNFEIKKMLYACNGGGILENTLFYDISITNRSCENFNNTILSLFTDPDNLCYNTKIGCDSSRSLAYFYSDFNTQPLLCGSLDSSKTRPIGCLKLLNASISGSNSKMSSFSYFVNGNGGNLTDPNSTIQYRNYQEGNDKFGFNYEFNNSPYKYVFPSNPKDSLGWSDCKNYGNDKRMLMNSPSITFQKDSTIQISYALLFIDADTASGQCFDRDIWISPYADSVQYYFDNNLFCSSFPTSIQTSTSNPLFSIFPNPASDIISLNFSDEKTKGVSIRDMLGRSVYSDFISGKNANISTLSLENGVYFLSVHSSNQTTSQKFIIQK